MDPIVNDLLNALIVGLVPVVIGALGYLANEVIKLLQANVSREQYAMFKAYVTDRHGDGDMAQMTFGDFRAMIEDSVDATRVIEHRDDEGRLIAAVLADRLADGLSAVYSFFDPSLPQRSLGTHVVLDLIARAEAEGLPFVYLGYWIAGSRKMAYKSRFRLAEVMVEGSWLSFKHVPEGENG